jgi:hypothetical protein
MTFAFTLQRITSSVASGLRGGMLASRSFVEFSNVRGWTSLRDEDTMIDEFAGLALAAAGIAFQLMNGFRLPLPFSLILLPITLLEFWLQWQVTWA